MATPDLIVGVDFGMTCTGVAYASASTGVQSLRVIDDWPGKSHKDEIKTPTRLVYNLDSPGEKETTVLSWGFQCNERDRNDPTKTLRDWFKPLLESEHLNQKNQTLAEAGYPAQSEADVTRWLEDYLSQIYRHIKQKISSQYNWETSTVVFIFSLPTTWSSHAMIERKFKNSIFRAGFGSVGTNHKVELGLTEAEAAAVYTADAGHNIYQEGEVILVCDAGGGTTDASIHRISSVIDKHVELDALLPVQGMAVGSTRIDTQFAILAQEWLQSQGFPERDAEDLARTMMDGEDFQNIKRLFGHPKDPSPPEYKWRIPKLESETSHGSNQHLELKVSSLEMREFFDSQIHKIFNLIDNVLDQLKRSDKHSAEEVSKIVLSGGFGSSHYVRTQLASRYSNIHDQRSDATRIKIISADEPQLAVVKGLVINKLQRISRGRSVLRSRCCRASYGIVSNILYKKRIHKDIVPVKSLYDGKKYATNQIIWLVKQGEKLSEDHPIEHTFLRHIELGQERSPWTDKIASSKLPPDRLPSRADPQYIHCKIKSDLTHIPLKGLKKGKRRFWKKRVKKCYRLYYTVKIIIDPAHIRFELWYKGTNYTKDHPIAVEWGEAAIEAAMEVVEPPAIYAQ